MELRRRVEKSYTIDEMMIEINKEFIGNSIVEDARHYIIGNTCFTDDSEKFLVADLRYDADPVVNLLPTYYGNTILEAVTKCFVDRFNRSNNE